jgi:hypothetical protein
MGKAEKFHMKSDDRFPNHLTTDSLAGTGTETGKESIQCYAVLKRRVTTVIVNLGGSSVDISTTVVQMDRTKNRIKKDLKGTMYHKLN